MERALGEPCLDGVTAVVVGLNGDRGDCVLACDAPVNRADIYADFFTAPAPISDSCRCAYGELYRLRQLRPFSWMMIIMYSLNTDEIILIVVEDRL